MRSAVGGSGGWWCRRWLAALLVLGLPVTSPQDPAGTAPVLERASPERCYNDALAALRDRRLEDAEVAIETLGVRGGPRWLGLRDFLLGNLAFARCDRAAAQALGPEAEPFAFAPAVASAREAAAAWQDAAAQRRDWPAARRNAERAQQRLARLVEQQQEAAARQRAKRALGAPPPPPADPASLEQRLDERAAAKRGSRGAQPRGVQLQVERDW
ncbi:MAG: hypothetical protein AAF628_11950 [Planctomycetota bacterium]